MSELEIKGLQTVDQETNTRHIKGVKVLWLKLTNSPAEALFCFIIGPCQLSRLLQVTGPSAAPNPQDTLKKNWIFQLKIPPSYTADPGRLRGFPQGTLPSHRNRNLSPSRQN